MFGRALAVDLATGFCHSSSVLIPDWSQAVEQFVAGAVGECFVELFDEHPLGALP